MRKYISNIFSTPVFWTQLKEVNSKFFGSSQKSPLPPPKSCNSRNYLKSITILMGFTCHHYSVDHLENNLEQGSPTCGSPNPLGTGPHKREVRVEHSICEEVCARMKPSPPPITISAGSWSQKGGDRWFRTEIRKIKSAPVFIYLLQSVMFLICSGSLSKLQENFLCWVLWPFLLYSCLSYI